MSEKKVLLTVSNYTIISIKSIQLHSLHTCTYEITR